MSMVNHTNMTSSFNSNMVNKYVSWLQDQFVTLLLGIAAWLNLMPSVLTLHMDFGPGFTRTSTTACEPMVQPLGPPPGGSPQSLSALRLITSRTNRFVDAAKERFQMLVDRICQEGRTAMLNMDMKIGEHHTNFVLRLGPRPRSSRVEPSPFAPSPRFAPRPIPGPIGPDSDMDVDSDSPTSSSEHEMDEAERIIFYPPPPGAVASFITNNFPQNREG